MISEFYDELGRLLTGGQTLHHVLGVGAFEWNMFIAGYWFIYSYTPILDRQWARGCSNTPAPVIFYERFVYILNVLHLHIKQKTIERTNPEHAEKNPSCI